MTDIGEDATRLVPLAVDPGEFQFRILESLTQIEVLLRRQTAVMEATAAMLVKVGPLIERFERTSKSPAGRLFLGRLTQ